MNKGHTTTEPSNEGFEKTKSKARAKISRVFGIAKNKFGEFLVRSEGKGKTLSRHIRRFGRLRLTGMAAGLGLVILATLMAFPISEKSEQAEATAGTVSVPTLTMTTDYEDASVDLIPTSNLGTFATSDAADQAKFTVTTDSYTGYTLSIKHDSSDDGELVNSSSSSAFESITSATSASDFSANTSAAASNYNGKWGYLPNIYNSAANTDYQVAPTTTATVLNTTTGANGSTSCTNPLNVACSTHEYTISVGARADYTLPTGTYTNTYTLTAVANPITYNINYYNIASDVYENATFSKIGSTQTGTLLGDGTVDPLAVTLTNTGSSLSRTTYTFAGWCRASNNTSVAVNSSIQTNPSTPTSTNKITAYYNPATLCNGSLPPSSSTENFIKAGDSTLNIDPTKDNSTINLYAVWKATSFDDAYGTTGTKNMQNSNTSTYCAKVTPNQITTLTDTRGGTYKVIKAEDGKCWMMDNLDLDAYAYRNSFSTSNTHITDSTALTRFKSGGGSTTDKYATGAIGSTNSTNGYWTSSYSYSVPLINRSGKCDSSINSSYPCVSPYQNANYTNSTVISMYGGSTTYNIGAGGYKVGTYYNYCAASLGSYCYGNGTSAGSSATGNATTDICPAYWRMPTGGSSGEYQALATAITNNHPSTWNVSTSPYSLQTMLSTPVSGYYTSGSARRQGTYGYFWSSTYNSSTYMYYMYVSGTGVNPQTNDLRNLGGSVRCVAQ